MSKEEKRIYAVAQIKGQSEPAIGMLTYGIDLLNYLNYHNTCSSDKERRAWAMAGMKFLDREEEAKFLDMATDFELHQVGPLLRARMRDYFLENKHLTFCDNEINRLVEKYKKRAGVKPVVTEEAKPLGPTLDEKNEALARSYYGEDIQGAVDDYVINVGSNFSMKSYLITNRVSPAVAMLIAEKLVRTVLEIKEAYEGKDEQLVEAYSQWGKVQFRKFLGFMQQLLQDCIEHGKVVKALRKPRVSKKPKKSPVAKLKFLQRDMELKLSSIDPEEILGATELYAYRTNRRFIYYKAKAGETLSIQGQTVVNYDDELSGAKTIRKPYDFFENFNTGRKVIKESFDKINSSKGDAPARISEDMLLLKAFK